MTPLNCSSLSHDEQQPRAAGAQLPSASASDDGWPPAWRLLVLSMHRCPFPKVWLALPISDRLGHAPVDPQSSQWGVQTCLGTGMPMTDCCAGGVTVGSCVGPCHTPSTTLLIQMVLVSCSVYTDQLQLGLKLSMNRLIRNR